MRSLLAAAAMTLALTSCTSSQDPSPGQLTKPHPQQHTASQTAQAPSCNGAGAAPAVTVKAGNSPSTALTNEMHLRIKLGQTSSATFSGPCAGSAQLLAYDVPQGTKIGFGPVSPTGGATQVFRPRTRGSTRAMVVWPACPTTGSGLTSCPLGILGHLDIVVI
jgi:hypothetical protein